jgi:hypothetical protein
LVPYDAPVAEKVYDTPLAQKLGIKEDARVALLGAPEDVGSRLGPLPPGVRLGTGARGPLDVIVLFVTRLKDLERRFPAAERALHSAGGLWICYPKRASGAATDLTFENVQGLGLGGGLVDNKSIAWDETWSAVRFVYRLADRP